MNAGFAIGSLDLGLMIYVAGVLCGLFVIDARPYERLALAVLWPLGPLAFVVTVLVLLLVLPIAFPAVGIPFWLMVAAAWWFYSGSASV